MNEQQNEFPADTYTLIDTGENQRLEQVGPYRVVRPAALALYPKSRPELWRNVDGIYIKNETGSGHWDWRGAGGASESQGRGKSGKAKSTPPDPDAEFQIQLHDFRVNIRFTPFGHLGIFPEQLVNWRLLQKIGPALPAGAEALNLFAYSGLSTLACLSGGMAVCHLDSSKGMVDWARSNAATSNLADGKVRWIVEDVVKFIRREVKRGRAYAGVILDPPTFGRGSKGEVWKIERDLPDLLDRLVLDLCGGEPEFVILTCHSTGFTAHTLGRLLAGRIAAGHRDRGLFSANELFIPEVAAGAAYPSGSSVVFLSKRLRHLIAE